MACDLLDAAEGLTPDDGRRVETLRLATRHHASCYQSPGATAPLRLLPAQRMSFIKETRR